jgi:prepilin-type N-terminal cleavage/methylation domain-containing protein
VRRDSSGSPRRSSSVCGIFAGWAELPAGTTLASAPGVRRTSQKGFTLIELMIVVVVVGVLAGLAIFTYGTLTSKTKGDTEVRAILTEIQLRQEQFHVEHGRYHSTGASEADMHPSAPSGPNQANPFRPFPDTWQELRIQSSQGHVHCAYVTIAGRANDDSNIGPIAAGIFGFEAPGRDWYYVLAECDLDGDPSRNSLYFAQSDLDRVRVHDEGR